jgi:DNA polymerase V
VCLEWLDPLSESLSKNIILLVDCNSFFCSCERLFRPDLANRPVGVLSNNDGCFVSRSKELKALGVPMGAPFFQYKEICRKNKVAVFSSNFSLYTNISDRVMRTLAQFSNEIEVYSMDEAFLNIKGFKSSIQFPTFEDYLFHIKKTVELNTGIPVSIGVGPTKTLAKVANVIAKNHDVYKGVMSLLDSEVCNNALAEFEIDDIWGIGRALAPRLRLLGLKSAKDFRDYPNEKHLLKSFSMVEIYRQKELRGIQKFELNKVLKSKKNIMCSRSFGSSVSTLQELKAAVAHHVSSATEKLRRQGSLCRTVRVMIRTNRFKDTKQYYGSDEFVLDMATGDTRKIMDAALSVLDKIYVNGYEYKKAGVVLGGFTSGTKTQLSLFEKIDSVKSESLMKSMDLINAKSGQETIKFGITATPKKSWRMNQNSKSPSYVAGWNNLPKVK